ncbi:hypothetical protein [Enterovirga rhinocerotis]|uniref:Uncharacterized protein n=1 Tax=Enterovirga rhinocerotis TaxID=1339210 RepID=A0A4R7CC04_9HYPH|nr:hypothetical protein [Enterovirga rhinocerotis]TDR95668.1 hypothetical protein EV668_0051 [Enterovirga rhinocerotis]
MRTTTISRIEALEGELARRASVVRRQGKEERDRLVGASLSDPNGLPAALASVPAGDMLDQRIAAIRAAWRADT